MVVVSITNTHCHHWQRLGANIIGFILQRQRMAIEGLKEFPEAVPPPLQIRTGEIHLIDGTPLHILGVSEGVGTCAEVKGMWVLVLGFRQQSEPKHGIEHIAESAYVVLCRRPMNAEYANKVDDSVSCVELLQLVAASDDSVTLARTGKSVVYHNL